jgi:drug/metabolite transporter (DMT)-like permease
MNWVRTFQIAAAALAFVGLYLVFTDPRSDYVFASFILMICAAFLAYRFHLKQRLPERQKPDR